MYNDTFQHDLNIGREKEKEILNIFRNEGWIGDLLNTRAYGDLWVIKNRIPYVLEIKNEDNYWNSPNIIIEIYQGINEKPSGISICESQICIHTMKDNSVIYRTQYMRLFISANIKKYKMINYLMSDNHNKGLRMPTVDLVGLWWFDKCLTDNIPESKIFLEEL